MFIEATASRRPALRQEGHVNSAGRIIRSAKHGPPDGGRGRLVTASTNMALLTEGAPPN